MDVLFEYNDALLEPKMRNDGFNFPLQILQNCGILLMRVRQYGADNIVW